MKIVAVTTYAERHWRQHAQRCVESFTAQCPDVELLHFTDSMLEGRSSWLQGFKQRNQRYGMRRGLTPRGYNYRFDAVRFAHKVAAVELASAAAAEVLVWLDADIYTHSALSPAQLLQLLGDADVAYLRRSRKYPECGLVLYRLNEAGRALIQRVAECYRSDSVFQLAEWHDSFVFEHCRQQLADAGQLRCASLSGDFEHHPHPFVNGPLGAFMDHCKGPRKVAGRSRRTDLAWRRPEAYWNR